MWMVRIMVRLLSGVQGLTNSTEGSVAVEEAGVNFSWAGAEFAAPLAFMAVAAVSPWVVFVFGRRRVSSSVLDYCSFRIALRPQGRG